MHVIQLLLVGIMLTYVVVAQVTNLLGKKQLFPIMMDQVFAKKEFNLVLNLIGECGGKISWRRQILLS